MPAEITESCESEPIRVVLAPRVTTRVVLRTGATGATGSTGTPGAKGDKGDTGDRGEKGNQGDTGSTGAKGDVGEKGDRGDTGSTGPKGDPGDQGEKGEKGDPGDPAPVENFFSLASGFVSFENLAPLSTGKVIRYTYSGSVIRFRFISNDKTQDAFYRTYQGGILSDLVTTKRITI
jgi:hypothetical protein